MPTWYFLPFITFKFILTSTHNYTTQWWSLIQSPPRSQLENWVELDEPARAELPFYFSWGASLFTIISLCRSCCHIDSLVKNQCKYCGHFSFWPGYIQSICAAPVSNRLKTQYNSQHRHDTYSFWALPHWFSSRDSIHSSSCLYFLLHKHLLTLNQRH